MGKDKRYSHLSYYSYANRQSYILHFPVRRYIEIEEFGTCLAFACHQDPNWNLVYFSNEVDAFRCSKYGKQREMIEDWVYVYSISYLKKCLNAES